MLQIPNMVSGDLVKTFPLFDTYNLDSIRRTIGLYRLAPGGVIVCDFYDYETEKIGPYRIKDKYGYVKNFYTLKATPPIVLLYEEMCSSQYAIAAFFVNNTYVCTVYEDRLVYKDIEDFSVETFMLDEYIPRYRMMNVGWIKTRLVCTQVAMKPFLLQMNIDTLEVFMGKEGWKKLPTVAMIGATPDYAMYKRLLEQSDKEVVYMDMETGKEFYI